MIKKKVLIVAPYPISDTHHGGQKRVKAIYDFYKSVFTEVRFAAIFHRGQYADKSSDSFLLGEPDIIKKIDDMPYASELITAEAIDKDIHVRSAIGQLLLDYQPDIVQIEQGFAYLGLKAVLRDLNLTPKIIFSSQNIEHIMKEKIYKELNIPSQTAAELVDRTRQLERELCQVADLAIAVSQSDAKILRDMGARPIVIAPNGINKVKAQGQELKYWQKFKKDKKIGEAVTFIGSGHPPNWLGFLEMVGLDTAFLPSSSRIIIAGGVADYFVDTYGKKENQKFWGRVTAVGKLSEQRLSGLLSESEVLVLPITSGGGSNLKTAEAILSGKKVVATHYAFRGFENYKNLPNIYFADDKEGFRNSIIEAIDAPYIQPSAADIALAERVQWPYSLRPLLPELKKLSRRLSADRLWRRLKILR